MINNILASFGMWLTRRFGSVRPGEVPDTLVTYTPTPVKGSMTATIKGRFVGTFFVDHFTRDNYLICIFRHGEITACLDLDVELRPSTKNHRRKFVVTEEPLLDGRELPHEADASKEAKEND